MAVVTRTGTDFELQIHTSIAAFDAVAEQWLPAVAGLAVTVLVHTVDAEMGRPRYLPPTEPAEWARAILSTAGASHGYFLGAVDPDTGGHRDGQLAYRLYGQSRPRVMHGATANACSREFRLGTDHQAIPVPRQVVPCPHYLLSAIDGREQITVPTTA
ncbi:N-formylglutamate amidohydrolase [Rhodococcus sp. ACS1]|uniref:N-formylglutamate amidohydrolase n=1 Tax=Rhodococcus sp. ACS1 TaxID=2028570 RepID=UPI00211CA883|nr:N-formylglutamate amidohydrolase [Rhodococcus sp. ACS1]